MAKMVTKKKKPIKKTMVKKKVTPKKKAKFDPEGSGYDYAGAKNAGMKRDPVNKHFGSRSSKTGKALKGRGHKTWDLYVTGEDKAGYQIKKDADGRYSSKKSKKRTDNSSFYNDPVKKKASKTIHESLNKATDKGGEMKKKAKKKLVPKYNGLARPKAPAKKKTITRKKK